MGLRSLRENSALSPEGTAESSPGRQSWVDVTKTDLVPLGTTQILSSRVPSSLTGRRAKLFAQVRVQARGGEQVSRDGHQL
jgi:hypothetical protein